MLSKSTRYRRPFKLIYNESYKTEKEAAKREWYFKNTTEGNLLKKALIKNL